MFGGAAVGSIPYAGVVPGSDASVASPFSLLVKNPTIPRVFLIEATPYDPDAAAEVTRRYSIGALAPVYNSVLWQARVRVALQTSRAISDGPTPLGGRVLPQVGALTLENGDAALDALTGFYWDGRDITTLMGAVTDTYADFGTVFAGSAADATWTADDITVTLLDFFRKLDIDLQTTLYAGTGTLEGGDDLEGVIKPRCFGNPKNVSPVLVDRGSDVYQFNDRASLAVDAVYDQAVALTAANGGANDITDLALANVYAWTPVAGEYITDLAQGVIRTGAAPAGVLTADVQGDDPGPSTNTAAQLVKYIAVTHASFTDPTDFDAQSITTTDLRNANVLSLYIRDTSPRIPAVLDQLMSSVGGYWGFTRAGLLQVGIVRFGAPVLTIPEATIQRLERVATPDACYRAKVGYGRNWTVMTDEQIAAGATNAQKDFVSAAYRFDVTTDATVQTKHLRAQEQEIVTLLDTQAAAATEGQRHLDLIGSDYERFELDAERVQFRLEIGQTVRVVHSRYSMSGGRNFLVLGIREDTDTNLTQLHLWG